MLWSSIVIRRRQVALAWLGVVVPAACALAQTTAAPMTPAQHLLHNPFVLSAGGFLLQTDVRANLNGQSADNPEIDFDETFGTANDATRARIDGLWRINPRHHLRFMYFNNSVDRSRVIDRDVAWGDFVFQAGGRVDSTTRIRIYQLAYEYAFLRDPSYEVAGTFGLHVTDVSLKLSGLATITDPNGITSTASFADESGTATAPLPVLGLRGAWAVSSNWYLEGLVQVFSVKLDGYDGTWSDLRVGATYMFNPHLGLGLGYNRFTARLDADRPNFDGRVKFGYSGLLAFLTGTF